MSERFGAMLNARRRQLGISLQQAATTMKIRPQIIEYFEDENFAAMPPRGYAQSLIATYASYLGLNPHMVVDAYFDALHEYERGGGSAGRYQDAAFDPNPRGSLNNSRYHLRDVERPSSRFAQRPPQAGYVTEAQSEHEPMAASRLRSVAMADRSRPRTQGAYDPNLRSRTTRAYREEALFDDPRGQRARSGARAGAPVRARQGGAGYGASTDPHRRSSQGRPGARPGNRSNAQRGGSSRGRQGSGHSTQLAIDPKLLLMAVVALVAIAVLATVLLMRGCAPEPKAAGSTSTSQVKKVDSSKADDKSSDDASSQDDGDANATAASKDNDEPQQPIVTIKVKEEGVVAWVEVNLDGKSVLGKQVVGPFEQEFTVTSQIDITTDSPSEVAVYKNGKKVRYDTKVSGVAKVSISAPKIETVDLTIDTDDDGIADMTLEDARDAGYDVESRAVDKLVAPKKEYENGTLDVAALAQAQAEAAKADNSSSNA